METYGIRNRPAVSEVDTRVGGIPGTQDEWPAREKILNDLQEDDMFAKSPVFTSLS